MTDELIDNVWDCIKCPKKCKNEKEYLDHDCPYWGELKKCLNSFNIL